MTASDTNEQLREQLILAISGRQAHVDFETALANVREEQRGIRPAGAPHSPWELLEHMRIAQRDILDFSRDGRHQSPKWPEEYWPPAAAPADAAAWDQSLQAFLADRAAFEQLLRDKAGQLFTPVPHGDGQTLLREALLIASHNSYHLGQLVYATRLLEQA